MTTSQPIWTCDEVLTATGGQTGTSPDDWVATGVSIDSRTCRSGDLFVAITGNRFDGHDFLAEALKAGAAAAIVSSETNDVEMPLVHVKNGLQALTGLGRAARNRTDASVVAVTGSVGKTGTKDAMSLALGSLGPTHATSGNLNNHIGVPLTLARMPPNVDYAVIEMGMNRAGEIHDLSLLVCPDVSVITTIAAVHLEFFDHLAGIASAKAEIFDGMCREGVAVLNRDNAYFEDLAARAWAQGLEGVLGFGEHPEADIHLLSCEGGDDGSEVVARLGDRIIRYRLNVPGRHWVHNSLAVCATVYALGGDLDLATSVLTELTQPKGRGARIRIQLPLGGLTVVDDSYNGSPTSMRAAFTVLGNSQPKEGGRRIAVLGDMLELGSTSAKLHAGLAGDLIANRIDKVFCAGPDMGALDDALPAAMRGGAAPDSKTLSPHVCGAVRAGDIVLVKGSLGSRMAVIVDSLCALDINGRLET
ncbi:MAG TPA: UDP-N-acetylmuramoylalanyl-D-glutamyl-2, 6-diaminopimelate--D-alanyl-D-alanine ligase, partial [Rhodospirillaceae bacterium]|nr:UDP-N-acetylmuramoylalanyl-D-glutamyl-2, 6-diaminopimelate--D-alanyl-D-alanine ligase [Rhodospirillaceae bacterium]